MSEANAYLAGRPCPKCGYARTAADTNPDWQCPKCRIAYLKYRPGAAQLGARLAAGGREMAAEAKADRSVYALIAANLVAAVVAVAMGMTLRDLLAVYWIQSVIIGLSFFIRILSLRKFSTEAKSADGQPVAGTAGDKYTAAILFLVGYGFMHIFYFMLVVFDPNAASGGASRLGIWLGALVFAVNHSYSLFHNIRLDRFDDLNLGTLISLPYMRIIPMHFIVVMGAGIFRPSTSQLVLFIILKTAADVVMHTIEHHELRKGSSLRELRDRYFDR